MQKDIAMLAGSAGTGKTTLGLQFLVNGINKYGENGIYVTFEELPDQIYRDAANFGWDLKKLEEALAKIDSRGGTAMRDATTMSMDYLKEKGKKVKKVLLVVTDGDDNTSAPANTAVEPGEDPPRAAPFAGNRRIPTLRGTFGARDLALRGR